MHYFSLTILAFMLLITSRPANADVVELRGGDRLSGTIMLLKDPAALRFHSRFKQMLYIPWNEVIGLYDQNGSPVQAEFFSVNSFQETTTHIDSRRVTNKPFRQYNMLQNEIVLVSPEFAPDYQALLAESNAQEEKLKKSHGNRQKFASNGQNSTDSGEITTIWGAKWSGRANLGASVQTGNSKKNAINADATLKAKWDDKHRAKIEAEYNRENDDGTTTENNKSLKGTYDYFFKDNWFFNSNLGFEQDDIDQIDLRTTLGIGLGHQLYERDDLNLQYVLGPSYLRTKFNNGNSENSLAINWSLDYDQKFYEDAIQVFHNHGLLIPTNDTDAYLFDSKTGVRVPLKVGLIGTFEIDFEWDNDPEIGVQEDDTKYSLKLGYEW